MADLEMAIKHMANHIAEGNTHANASAPAELMEARRLAVARGVERRPPSDGNAHPNEPSHVPPNTKRVGDVKAPVKSKVEGNKQAVEGTPPFAKETISKDGWTKASAKAKQMFQARK
jgi:hypothetical protein